MRKIKKRVAPAERTKKATLEDLTPLTEKGRIFYQARPETLEKIAAHSVVRTFDRGNVLFEQGERTDNLPLFCVLSGRFNVIHIWGSNQRHVGTEGTGGLVGDVELLLRGESLDEDESAIRGISTDQTWAKIQCSAPGEVLSIWPADFLLEADQAVMVALARSLARKLLLRSAIAEPKTILPKTGQVQIYLRRVARDLAKDLLEPGDSIPIPMSLADVAEEVECAKQTVASALKGLQEKYPGFSHERSLIVVPKRFIEEPLELFDTRD